MVYESTPDIIILDLNINVLFHLFLYLTMSPALLILFSIIRTTKTNVNYVAFVHVSWVKIMEEKEYRNSVRCRLNHIRCHLFQYKT